MSEEKDLEEEERYWERKLFPANWIINGYPWYPNKDNKNTAEAF
ncbi:unnamed protein product [marine sediment metagenome]|uniref:Uncharacterized protein n=1 Tax=marine sediment metagenome TaxID=412755 RepID=X0XJC9_9ZZZZ